MISIKNIKYNNNINSNKNQNKEINFKLNKVLSLNNIYNKFMNIEKI